MVPHHFHGLVILCFTTVLISAAATPLATIIEPDTVEVTANTVKYVPSQKESIVQRLARDEGSKSCKKLAVRREWRDLNDASKNNYINAVKCLHDTRALNQTLPSKFNRYDEFVYTHMRVAEQIHGVGQFLPWHRHFGYLYETALREQCHYQGPFPYWDWTRDTNGNKPISESPIFDTKLGFGGDGVPGTYTPPTDDDGATWPLIPEEFKGCIRTGPFADTVLHVGPGIRFSDHCLNRNFDEARRPQLTAASVSNISNQTNYDDFWNSLDGFPFKSDFRLHDSGHVYIGGDMSNFYSSPNDPIFFLHHAGLDRVWRKWQNVDLSTRLYQISGRMRPFPPYGETTLDYQLPYDGFAPSLPIRDTMDIQIEPYCYTYAD